jgi:hypothetical protein
MKLEEYADAINVDLIVQRHANRVANLENVHLPWTAELENVELKGDGTLVSLFGNGENPAQAMSDLVSQMRGNTIVVDATETWRREFVVPLGLGF